VHVLHASCIHSLVIGIYQWCASRDVSGKWGLILDRYLLHTERAPVVYVVHKPPNGQDRPAVAEPVRTRLRASLTLKAQRGR